MAHVGRVKEIWRFPFKSMAGERLERCTVGRMGMVGDRGWAVRDEKAQEMRGAKKIPALLQCKARYVTEPREGEIPAVEITLPGGQRFRSDDDDAAARLSAFVERPVSVWPLRPASDQEHYRRGLPDNPDMLAELRTIFGRLEEEPLPDVSIFPPELFQYTSPLGTYFDAFPLHLLTTTSLATVAQRTPDSAVDLRRFRANFVIEPVEREADRPAEIDWCGKTLAVGDVRIKIEMPTVRCVMITLPQGDLAKAPAILRTVVRDMDQHLGVYASVASPGTVSVGDRVELVQEG